MTTIGDKRRFAIEFELDEAKQRDPVLAPWLFGHMRWWSCSEAIGRYEADTTIRDLAVEAQRFLAYGSRRRDEESAALPKDELYRTIVYALFDDHGQSEDEVEAAEARYRPFVVKPAIDVFDAWDLFLIEGDKQARLIWRPRDAPDVHECRLEPGEFDEVLRQFLAVLPR